MKLLLDENLSRRIVPLLQAEYPGNSQIGPPLIIKKDHIPRVAARSDVINCAEKLKLKGRTMGANWLAGNCCVKTRPLIVRMPLNFVR